jgi:hypothetical protein
MNMQLLINTWACALHNGGKHSHHQSTELAFQARPALSQFQFSSFCPPPPFAPSHCIPISFKEIHSCNTAVERKGLYLAALGLQDCW